MTTAPDLPPIIASRYLPVRLIAKGGMGAVYEVEHARTGEHLALKVLLSSVGSSAEELERFKREARAPARIKSEHVVRVTDADVAPELGGAPFLVMELLEGADLEREVASSPPAPAIVVEWLRQVARTLDKAHQLGIVHRDLKPQNLFLARAENRDPIVKILDFGIVKMTEESAGGTGSGQILGTPKYMSPEQASGKGRVTPAADRFSLALVAYRLLTGESYYQGGVLNVLAELLHDPIEPPSRRHPGFGDAFDDWFLKACHRDPAARFASAWEQIEALSAALGLPAIESQPGQEPIGEGRTVRSRRTVVAAVLVTAGLAAVSIVAVRLKQRPTPGGSEAVPAAVMSAGSAVARPVPPTAPSAPSPPPEVPRAETKSIPPTPAAGAGSSRTRRRRPPDSGSSAATTSGPEKPTTPDPYVDQY
jgi:eukaryotic-like serine/threonine-protein kinase